MPNPEVERLKLVARVDILEKNVADLEKRLADAYDKLRDMSGELYDCRQQLRGNETTDERTLD